jgi:hypothetical protein
MAVMPYGMYENNQAPYIDNQAKVDNPYSRGLEWVFQYAGRED